MHGIPIPTQTITLKRPLIFHDILVSYASHRACFMFSAPRMVVSSCNNEFPSVVARFLICWRVSCLLSFLVVGRGHV
jgi:hypothetical protein